MGIFSWLFGGNKKKDQTQDKILAAINNLGKPETNPAQNFLSDEALKGADFLKKGDFSQLPTGMFFDFKKPNEQRNQYENLTNIGAEGTFALGDDGGRATEQSKQYLNDKFARDTSQNYQDNISNAAGNVKSALGAVAATKSGNDMAVINALQNLNSSMTYKPGFLGSLTGMSASLLPALLGASSPQGAFKIGATDGTTAAQSQAAMLDNFTRGGGRGYGGGIQGI